MNTTDNSYFEILNRLKYFADNHYMINSFSHGQIAQMDTGKSTEFPTMHVTPVQFQRTGKSKLFQLDIVFADLPRTKDDKPTNEMEVISDCDRLADDLVNEIKNGGDVFGDIVELFGDATTETFMEEHSNVLTGVVLRLSLSVPYTWNACDIPAEWVTGDGTEPQFGSRELTLDVYDEGVFEVAARSMDFVGSGVSVTYEGNRAIVTITGGGGGGAVDSVNGQTGVVVLDAGDVGADASGTAASAITTHVAQADPHTQYALESSLGAVATSNDYNDLDNLPNLSGYGDMFKSTYDTDNDGIVDSSKKEMVEVINKTGATLTKGTIVYLKSSSSSGTHPEVLKADATTEATSSKTIGAIYENIANDATGYVVTSGEVNNLDTSAYVIGDKLWLSTTAGQVTTTPPVEPNHTVFIGTVTRSQNGNGRVLYAIQNGYELDELHGVLIASPATNDVLCYASDGLWKNKALSKSDVGLGNVDNTSDANKPVSTATQAALDLKKNKSEQRIFETTTNQTSSSTTRADVSEWVVPMAANKKYRLEIFGAMQSGATTTGCSIGFYLSSGTATINGIIRGLVSTGASANAIDAFINTITTTAGAAGSFFTTSGVGAVNTPHGLGGSFYIESNSDCDFKVQFGSEVAGSSTTLLSGSALVVDQLN